MNDVVVDHIPETTDIDFVKWIYDQGAWIGVDRMPIISFPGEYAVGTETRIKFVKTMLDAGMGRQDAVFSRYHVRIHPVRQSARGDL